MHGVIVNCDLSYLYFFCWKILLPKLSNSHNHQLLSKGTKFQTSFFLFVFCLKLKFIFYNSKAQDQMCDWTKDFYIFLECKNLNPSLILHDSHIWFWKFLYILGCSGPQCGIPSFLVLGLGLPILIFFFLSRLWFSPTWAEYYQHWKKSLEWGLNIQPMLCLAMNWVNFCWYFLCHVLPR